jgi:hypothetical protein
MIMPLTYTNRKGKTYTLCQRRTQTGNVRYFFSPDPEGKTVVDHIPTGYEIRENVNGQVTLSKKRPQLIRPQERRAVEQAVSRHPKAKNYRVDVKGKHIIVYENISPGLDTILGIFESFVPLTESRREALEAKEAQFSQFSPVMRFELEDPETRGYHVARMGYTGHGGWCSLVRWGDIEILADEIIPLLGTDEFFELW